MDTHHFLVLHVNTIMFWAWWFIWLENLITPRKKLLSLFLVKGYLCQLAGVHYIIILQQICFVFPFKSLFLLRWATFDPGWYPSPTAKTKWIIFSFGPQHSCSRCHKFDTAVIVAFKNDGLESNQKKKRESTLLSAWRCCSLFKVWIKY